MTNKEYAARRILGVAGIFADSPAVCGHIDNIGIPMITITRLLELKKDLAVLHLADHRILTDPFALAALQRVGTYQDILEDYLRIQQGSA